MSCVLCPVFLLAAEPDALSLLRHSDPRSRRDAIERIVQEGPGKGLRGVRRALDDADPRVRESAAWALGQMQDFPGVRDLSKRFEKEKSLIVKVAIVEALGKIRGPQAAATLEAALGDPSPIVKRAAIFGIGLSARWESARKFLEAAADPSPQTRRVAALALAPFNEREVQHHLARFIQDRSSSVREAAVFSMKTQSKTMFVETALGGLRQKDELVRRISARVLSLRGWGEQAKMALKTTLEEDESPAVKLEARVGLKNIEEREEAARRRAEAERKAREAAEAARRKAEEERKAREASPEAVEAAGTAAPAKAPAAGEPKNKSKGR